MELACGFFYLMDGLLRIDNKALHLIDVTRIFEKDVQRQFGRYLQERRSCNQTQAD